MSKSFQFLNQVGAHFRLRVSTAKRCFSVKNVFDQKNSVKTVFDQTNSVKTVFDQTNSIKMSRHVVRHEVVKSPEDDRQYRGLVLSNGLKAVLVSDPATDKSAAALDVHVGSMSDPQELPGLVKMFC